MRVLKLGILASVLGFTSVSYAAVIGGEIGGVFGANFNDARSSFDADTEFSAGLYGRLWIKPSILRIAPFVKWESIGSLESNHRYNNFQYGGLLGVNFSIVTPYIGMAYSHFTNSALEPTWAVNYGIQIALPAHITLGIDGSYQHPKFLGMKVEMHKIGATLGIQF